MTTMILAATEPQRTIERAVVDQLYGMFGGEALEAIEEARDERCCWICGHEMVVCNGSCSGMEATDVI